VHQWRCASYAAETRVAAVVSRTGHTSATFSHNTSHKLYSWTELFVSKAVENFLRSTLTQKRLNHVALLHCHRERTDLIDLKPICNNFIVKNDLRASTFALFPYIITVTGHHQLNMMLMVVTLVFKVSFCHCYWSKFDIWTSSNVIILLTYYCAVRPLSLDMYFYWTFDSCKLTSNNIYILYLLWFTCSCPMGRVNSVILTKIHMRSFPMMFSWRNTSQETCFLFLKIS